MSLRPGAVDFDSKWNGLKVTIHDVVQLRRVRMAIWNDHYSYPINSNKILHMGPFLYLINSQQVSAANTALLY